MNQKSKERRLHVIWALNAFEDTESRVQHMAKAISSINNLQSWQIEPVHMLNSGQPLLTRDLFDRWLNSFRKEAEESLKDLLAHVSVPNLMPPQVGNSTTHSEAWIALGEFAQRKSTDFIAINTHARRGLSRYFLGSFAESLLASSTIPLLLFSPSAAIPPANGPLFYPVSFTEQSKAGLPEAIKFARSIGSDIILYHKWPVPELSRDRLDIYFQTTRTAIDALKSVGESWVQWIKNQGVDCRLLFEETAGSITAEAILDKADELRARIIILCPDSFQPEREGFSHMTREIIRMSHLPIFAHYLPKKDPDEI